MVSWMDGVALSLTITPSALEGLSDWLGVVPLLGEPDPPVGGSLALAEPSDRLNDSLLLLPELPAVLVTSARILSLSLGALCSTSFAFEWKAVSAKTLLTGVAVGVARLSAVS